MTHRICTVDGCTKKHKGHGLCEMHLVRVRAHGDAQQVRGFVSVEQRFMAKVDKDGPTPAHRLDLGPCWLWTAGLTSAGYGQFRDGEGSPHGAHRWLYVHLHGTVTPGLELDHLCFVRRCVNPAHLEPVTKTENIRRGDSPTAVNGRRDTCVAGHPLTVDNTYSRKDRPRRRECRRCRREAKRL